MSIVQMPKFMKQMASIATESKVSSKVIKAKHAAKAKRSKQVSKERDELSKQHKKDKKEEDKEDVKEDDINNYSMKSMNCPLHCLMFKSKNRSYKDLPIRYADFGVLHRNELVGTLTG